jgi:hypothetical protein
MNAESRGETVRFLGWLYMGQCACRRNWLLACTCSLREPLAPYDVQAWRDLGAQVSFRQKSCWKQSRFRRDSSTYLAALEAQLLKDGC